MSKKFSLMVARWPYRWRRPGPAMGLAQRRTGGREPPLGYDDGLASQLDTVIPRSTSAISKPASTCPSMRPPCQSACFEWRRAAKAGA